MLLKSGTLLQNGKYRIIRYVGQGGFGITYEAEQVLLRRKVALKEFFMKDCCERDGQTSRVTVGTGSQRALVEKFRGKFIREAQMMAGMNHPHIVRVLDVFEENETAYYVMEILPGGSLKGMVDKDGPLSEPLAENYVRQVADALAYIHARKTVHLDVKPSNILLNEDGDAVLIDFGISKHYDDAGDQTSSTPVGLSKGYAPLEQSRDGDVSQFTPPTDIYALGATLYYLVTGKVPPEATVVNEDGLDRPAGLSDRIWNVIDRAMQPRRKDRPQTIAAFLDLLGGASPIDDDDEHTRIDRKLKPKPEPDPVVAPKRKIWPWAVLGGVVAAILAGCFIVGGRRANDGEVHYWDSTDFFLQDGGLSDSLLEIQTDSLSMLYKSLASSLAEASKLRVEGLYMEGYDSSDRPTSRARRVRYFLTSLTVQENAIAPHLPVRIYVRITDPSGRVLRNDNSTLATLNGETVFSSASREIDYIGEAVELGIYFRDAGKLEKGIYTVEAFTSDNLLGTMELLLE